MELAVYNISGKKTTKKVKLNKKVFGVDIMRQRTVDGLTPPVGYVKNQKNKHHFSF